MRRIGGGSLVPLALRVIALAESAISPLMRLLGLNRYIRTFDGTDTYGTLADSVTFTGDFEVAFEFAAPSSATERKIVGSSTSTHYIALNTSGVLFAAFKNAAGGNAFLTILNTDWGDSKLHKGKFTRVGDTFTLTCDEGSANTTSVGALSCFYSRIGILNTTQYFKGEILSVEFTDNATEDELFHGLTLSDYLDADGSYEREIATYDGSAMYGTLGAPVTLAASDTIKIKFANVTTYTSATHLTDGIDSSDRGYIFASATNKVTWNTSVFSGCTLDGVAATSGTTVMPTDGKTHIFELTASATAVLGTVGCNINQTAGTFFLGEILSLSTTISSVTTTYPLNSGSTLYEMPEGEVLGSEEVADPTFDTACGVNWGCETGWSIAGGKASCDGTQTGNSRVSEVITGLSAGQTYQLQANITRVAGATRFYVSGFASASVTDSGVRTITFTAGASTLDIGVLGDASFVGDVDDLTVKHIPSALIYTGFEAGDWNTYARSPASANYIIDNDSTLYTQARGYGLGSEEVTNGDVSDGTTGWTPGDAASLAAVDDTLEVTNGNGYDWAQQSFATVAGESYFFDIDLRAGTGSAVAEIIGISGAVTAVISSGTFVKESFTFTATGSAHQIKLKVQSATASHTAYFDNISVKHIPKAILWTNFTSSDIELFTYNQQAVRWEGVERITNGGFGADTDWSKQSGWSIAGGVSVATAADGTSLYQTGAVVIGQRFAVTYSCVNITDGTFTTICGGTFGAGHTAVGTYSEVLEAASNTNMNLFAAVTLTATFDNVSVKRVLECS